MEPCLTTTPFIRPPRYYGHILSNQKYKTLTHFIILKTPLMRPPRFLQPGFYGPTVVVLTGFHCKAKDKYWMYMDSACQFPHKIVFHLLMKQVKNFYSRSWLVADSPWKLALNIVSWCCTFGSFYFLKFIVLIPDNAPINAFLELIEQMSTHSGRCRNKILENEVQYCIFLEELF